MTPAAVLMVARLPDALQRPSDGRCSFLWVAIASALLGLLASPRSVVAQERVTLDAGSVARRASASSPALRVAQARVEVARAHQVGMGAPTRENPTLQLWAGPRVLASGDVLGDVTLTVMWPFDLSGSSALRVRTASLGVRLAEAEADEARVAALSEALAQWVEVLAAEGRAVVLARHVAVEEQTLRAAQARFGAGAAGREDPMLAAVSLARARAEHLRARGERDAHLATLRGLVGLAPEVAVEINGSLDDAEALSLEALQRALANRVDLRRGDAAIERSRADALTQERYSLPTPRLGLSGGRENEYFGRLGLDVALPVYQRNQNLIAVTRSQVSADVIARDVMLAHARTELLAAWSRYSTARECLATLAPTLSDADEIERLSLRGFELGQRDLAATLVNLREAASVRAAHLDALIAVARTRLEALRSAGDLR